jgi:uncharacterized protein (TIGR02117 family)
MLVRKILRIFAFALLTVLSAMVFYGLVAVILSAIPVNAKGHPPEGIIIYIITNGVHSDLVLPIGNSHKDWRHEVKFEHTAGKDTSYRFVAFGWGDKEFYLETPTWSDLKFSTAVKSTFGLGPSAVHTTFYRNMSEGDGCIKLFLSEEQYLQLVEFIGNTFEKDEAGNLRHIQTDAVYGSNDAFYEAHGRYNLFKTCNTWTNTGLKISGQKACLWTPFDKGIFWQYRR